MENVTIAEADAAHQRLIELVRGLATSPAFAHKVYTDAATLANPPDCLRAEGHAFFGEMAGIYAEIAAQSAIVAAGLAPLLG